MEKKIRIREKKWTSKYHTRQFYTVLCCRCFYSVFWYKSTDGMLTFSIAIMFVFLCCSSDIFAVVSLYITCCKLIHFDKLEAIDTD